ncbi:MAG: ABC transporter ATP-binding protein [Candidatus Dormibacteraceae bacterium]
MLEVTDLCVAYGAVQALRGVSLRAEAGSITAVLGANGAGKTTLLRTVSGLVRPRSGSVRWSGRDLTGAGVEDIVRRGVGHVPEGRGLIQELSVEENLRLGGLWRGDRSDRRRALGEVWDLFPVLAERRRLAAAALSGGERQMLAIGRALMGRPRLLLLDEPSLGLAPLVTARIMALLRDLTEERRLAVILVEQNARSALSIADVAVVLNLGQVVVADAAASVAADSDLRHHYLGF